MNVVPNTPSTTAVDKPQINAATTLHEGQFGGESPETTPDLELEAEKCCNVAERRWYQLFALAFGCLEVVLSFNNALTHGSFALDDVVDFVFSSSAVMEVVGLGATLLFSLRLVRIAGWKEGPGAEENLEALGAPLSILANGVRQGNKLLRDAGLLGVACQALVVFVCWLILLRDVPLKATLAVFVPGLILACSFVLFAWGNYSLWLRGDVCRYDDVDDEVDEEEAGPDCAHAQRQAAHAGSANAAFERMDVSRGMAYLLVLMPVVVDVAEILALLLTAASWASTMLSVLDIVALYVTCVVVCPWGFVEMKHALPRVTGQMCDVVRFYLEQIRSACCGTTGGA